jgi:hypothetical protein
MLSLKPKLNLGKKTITKLNNQPIKFGVCKSAAGCDSVGGEFLGTCVTNF